MAARSTATKPRTAPAKPKVTVELTGEATSPPVETNGHSEVAAEIVEPEVVEPKPVPQFTFHPKGDGGPITVPVVMTAIPEEKQRWFFWKLRKLVGFEQPIFWLEQAHISDDIQERLMLLPDQEWSRFFEEWMAYGTGGTAGE
jgi:hypothetical protein